MLEIGKEMAREDGRAFSNWLEQIIKAAAAERDQRRRTERKAAARD